MVPGKQSDRLALLSKAFTEIWLIEINFTEDFGLIGLFIFGYVYCILRRPSTLETNTDKIKATSENSRNWILHHFEENKKLSSTR